MPSDVRSFSAGSTASGRTAHTGRSNHTGLDDSKSLKAWARGVAEDVLALRREFEALRASGAGRPNLSRPDSWELPSPAYAKLPGRRLGKAGVSMREAAFAIGMSPARQPPGISPVPCTNAMLLGGARDDEETVRWPSQGAHGPEPPDVPEVPDSDFWDNRLQAVEGEVTRLGEEFRRLEEEQQHATRQRGDLRQENELLLSRLSALEGDKAHTGAQVQELHALLSALDRGARGLSEDLTCVVQEVELRLAKIGHELASQKSALQQVQSEMMSPATPDMAPVPVVVVVERLCASNPRMQRSEATRLCQSFRAWQGIVRPPERLRPSAAASMPMIEQHLQQRFEWLEQRALLSARCEVLRQREELCLAVGAELHEANHAHFEIDEAKVLKLCECLSEVQQRVEGVEASLPQLVSQVSCLSDRCAALGQEPRHPAQALNPTPESLNAVRSDVGAVARSVAQLDEVFREALELNEIRDSKVEELRQVLSEVAEASAAPEDAIARQAVQVVWQSVEELQAQATESQASKEDVAKDLDTFGADLALLKAQASGQVSLSRSVEELREVCQEDRRSALKAEDSLRDACARVEGLEEAVTNLTASYRKSAKAADVNDLRHSLAELQEVFREAEQKTATEARSNLDHVHFRVQELSEAVSEVKQEGQDTAKAADVNDLRHSLAELQEVFREAEQKTATEARSNLDHVRCRVQELSEVVLALQGRPSAASELEDHQNLGEPTEVEEQPLDTQWEASAEPLPAHGIYQGKPRDARPRTQSSQPSGLRDGSPKGGDASGSIVGDTLSTNPAMASSFDRLDGTLPAASAEEHSGTIAAMQDELKLLAFEAQRQRRQSIKMHAELGQALASLEEQQLQRSHAEQDLWAHLQVHERQQQHVQDEVQSALAELAALRPGCQRSVAEALASLEEQQLQRSHAEQDLWAHLQVHERQQQHVQDEVQSALAELAALRPGCQRSVAEALASLEEQQLQRSHAEQVLVETVQADAAQTEAKVQSLKQEVGCAAEELQAGFTELRMSLSDALEVDMRPAQQIQSEQLAQTEASVVALRGALSLELGEAKRMLSEEMASQARSFSDQLSQGNSSTAAEIESVRCQLIETVEDSIELRRQLLALCRSRAQSPMDGLSEPITASSLAEAEVPPNQMPWAERAEAEEAQLKKLWSRWEGLAEEVRRLADRQTAAEQSASRGLTTMQQAVEGLSIRLGEISALHGSADMGQRR